VPRGTASRESFTTRRGELLFAEILNRHADKIIIRDPTFQIPPFWKRSVALIMERQTRRAALVVAIDTDGASAAWRSTTSPA
jgi:hypothetical protein